MADSRKTVVLLLLPRRDRVQEHVRSYKFKTKVELTLHGYKYVKDVVVYLRKKWSIEGKCERESILPPNTRLYNGGESVDEFTCVRTLRSGVSGSSGEVTPLYYDFLFPDEKNFLASGEIDHIPSHPSVRPIQPVGNGVQITEWKNMKKPRLPKKSRPKKKSSTTPEPGEKIRERYDDCEAGVVLPEESPRRKLKLVSPSPTPPHASSSAGYVVHGSFLSPPDHPHRHHENPLISGQSSSYFGHSSDHVDGMNEGSHIPFFQESNPASFPSAGRESFAACPSTAMSGSTSIPQDGKGDGGDGTSTAEKMVFRTFGSGIEQSRSDDSHEEEQHARIQEAEIEKETGVSLFRFLHMEDSSLPVGESLLIPGESRSVFR